VAVVADGDGRAGANGVLGQEQNELGAVTIDGGPEWEVGDRRNANDVTVSGNLEGPAESAADARDTVVDDVVKGESVEIKIARHPTSND